MTSPSLDDTCCRVDVLEKALSQEALTFHSAEDPIEAALVACHVTGSHLEEKEEYARLLNTSTTYMHRQSPKEILSVEEQRE